MCDLGKSFEKLKSYAFVKYRGVLIERKPGAYVYAGQDYYSKEELDAAIDLHLLHLEHSVNRLKTNQ